MSADLCKCGAPGVHGAAAGSLCPQCFDRLLGDARAAYLRSVDGIGFGRQVGPLRPDWGPGWADLECAICRAQWTGPVLEPCSWCIHWNELLINAHRKALLHPDPEIMVTVAQRETWARRLADGVKSEILTEHEARIALTRWEARHAA